MKGFILITLFFGVSSVLAQETATIENDANINIALDEINKVFYAPETNNLKSGAKSCDIVVTYTNFSEEAKAAFEYAVSLWETGIASEIPVNIHVSMDNLSTNILGQGKPSVFLRNFKSAPLANIYYPVALAEKVSGKEQNKSSEADITCSFNINMPWYFGTDGNTPATKYDFVSAVLHEIGHGLGISGFFKNEDGISKFANTSNTPSAYDYYIFNTNAQRIADNSIFPCPSAELTTQLTSNSLVVNGKSAGGEIKSATVYAPSGWVNGISIYHLAKNELADDTESETMYAYAFKGEAKHRISSNTLMVLAEIGWGYKSAEISSNVTASRDDLLNKDAVKVFPNPCKNFLSIQMIADEITSDVIIEVINLSGKSVYKELWSDAGFDSEKRIDLTTLEPGVYFVQTIRGNNKRLVNKIIKN